MAKSLPWHVWSVLILCLAAWAELAHAGASWKAGLARVKITPTRPLVLLGYGDRSGPFDESDARCSS